MSSTKDWRIRIQHILESIARIQKYLDGLTEETFSSDDKTQDAVVRNFQIIGEAVRHVPDAIQHAHSEVPWAEMRAMRHVLVHRYEAVDIPTVWTTATSDLPPLVPLLRSLLGESP
jgi:uncharacterized protein with HEPN domain